MGFVSKDLLNVTRRFILNGSINVRNYEKSTTNKDFLEDLLFEEIVVNQETGLKVKIPVLSASYFPEWFIEECDFSNSSWRALTADTICNIFPGVKVDDSFYEELKKLKSQMQIDNDYILDFSNSKARIRLTESFEAVNCHKVIVKNCNFSGVNMRNCELVSPPLDYVSFFNTDLSNTGLGISSSIQNSNFSAINSNLSGLDFSSRIISLNDIVDNIRGRFFNTNFSGTNVSIGDIDRCSLPYDELRRMINFDNLKGCYAGTKYITSIEQLCGVCCSDLFPSNRVRLKK